MERISSRQNPLVRRFRALVAGSNDDGAILDGERLLREALASGVNIEVAAFADSAVAGSHEALKTELLRQGSRVVSVSGPVLAAMSPVRQPSGVVAICTLRKASLDEALGAASPLVLLLSQVQDPGNVGAIVRAGEACGVTGIVAGEGTADPYGWKALRGSMGSAFRVPIAARVPLLDAARAARAGGLTLVAAVPRDGDPLPDTDLRQPTAILLGGEGAGLPQPLLQIADARVSIPMRPPVESLNVGVAAALIAYEAFRQRTSRAAGRDRAARKA